MFQHHELRNIIIGNESVKFGKAIQTVAGFFRRKKEAIPKVERAEYGKKEETVVLIEYLRELDFWHPELPATKYIGAGAEQRIFEGDDPAYVIKFNDGLFYAFWEEYC